MPPRKGFLEMKVEEREKFFDGIKKKKKTFSRLHTLSIDVQKKQRGEQTRRSLFLFFFPLFLFFASPWPPLPGAAR